MSGDAHDESDVCDAAERSGDADAVERVCAFSARRQGDGQDWRVCECVWEEEGEGPVCTAGFGVFGRGEEASDEYGDGDLRI